MHYIRKCGWCCQVIDQCRCAGPKEIIYDLCPECRLKARKDQASGEEKKGTLGYGPDEI